MFIDEQGYQTNNPTVYNAFMNQYFIENYWNNAEVQLELETLVNPLTQNLTNFTNSTSLNLIYFIDNYWNLFKAGTDNYKILSRSEFLAVIHKAINPVKSKGDFYINNSLTQYINESDEYIGYVSEMLDKSYLNSDDKSMNDITYYSPISKAEAIYTIVVTFYSNEYNKTTGAEPLTDFTNGGEIALKQGFIELNKKKPDFWKSKELVYGMEHNLIPNDLYRALLVADRHNLLDDMLEKNTKFKWSEGITKAETLRLLTDTLETIGREKGYMTNAKYGLSPSEDSHESLSCLIHVTYDIDSQKYIWTEEWEEAVRSLLSSPSQTQSQTPILTEEQIQLLLNDLARAGCNKYTGEEVYGILRYIAYYQTHHSLQDH